jgi:hypothetical protein
MKNVTSLVLLGLALGDAGCDRHAVPAPTPVPSAPAAAPAPMGFALTFDADTPGAPAAGVEAVIGDWVVAERAGARGLLVDGSRWRSGSPAVNLFPLAVARQELPTGDARMSVRFYPFAGRIDQAAGIAFGIQPDGSYVCVRANALEDNILWARVVRGRRTIIDTVRTTPTPTRAWHTLIVILRGHEMNVELDGVNRFHKTLDAVPRGRVGLWSKADSQVLFDDFRVERLP